MPATEAPPRTSPPSGTIDDRFLDEPTPDPQPGPGRVPGATDRTYAILVHDQENKWALVGSVEAASKHEAREKALDLPGLRDKARAAAGVLYEAVAARAWQPKRRKLVVDERFVDEDD